MIIFIDYYVYPSNSSVNLMPALEGLDVHNFTIHVLPRDNRINYHKL